MMEKMMVMRRRTIAIAAASIVSHWEDGIHSGTHKKWKVISSTQHIAFLCTEELGKAETHE
jgi:hypothetical protein